MDSICIEQIEYIDIQPAPHNNQTNVDFLKSTTTVTCTETSGTIPFILKEITIYTFELLWVITAILASYFFIKLSTKR